MPSLELREELKYGGIKYFLQTSYLEQQKQILSSFFRNGTVFDTIVQNFDEKPGQNELKELTKKIHGHNKRRLQFIFNARKMIRDSRDPVAHLRVARALLIRNLYNEAIAEAELALENGASDSAPYIILASSWYGIGDSDSAFKAVKKGIELSPDYPDLHNLMGLIYFKEKKCRLAVDCFKRAIGLNLYYGEPYLNLLRAYLLNSMIKEDYDLSRDVGEKFDSNIKRAVQLNSYLNTREIDDVRKLVKEERYEEALALLEKMREGSPRKYAESVILDLYLALIQSGKDICEEDIDQYKRKIEELIDKNPTFADAYNSLGILYAAKCKLLMDKAYSAFGKALEVNTDYKKAQKNLRLTENDKHGIYILLKALLD
ncbi:MAG: hypothetical protein JW746_00025 [Candidatus Krumholzibacteriota bacterium]|nr:hypothetical protein [Candidatus Krumholzibacteriota bacterium]